MTRRLLLLALACLALAPAAKAAAPGALVQLPGLDACISQTGADDARANGQECRHGSGLGGVDVAATSPDGKNVYATGFFGDISIMARDAASGALAPVACLSPDGTDGGTGSCAMGPALNDPTDVVVSPDGKNVYVAATGGITVFDRDPGTGLLSTPDGTAACVSEGGSGGVCVNGKAVDDPIALALSPDGTSLYAADGRGAVAVLQRSADGSLSQSTEPRTGCISEDGKDPGNLLATTACVDGKAVGNTDGLTVSPDGEQVYAIDNDQTSAVAVLNRASSTGELSQAPDAAGCVSVDGTDRGVMGACSIGKGLLEVDAIRVSPDGKNVYVTAFGSSAIAIFNRNASTGVLTQDPGQGACVSEDTTDQPAGAPGACAQGRGLEVAAGLALSPDGKFVYATSAIFGLIAADPFQQRGVILPPPHASGGIALFARDPATGALEQLPGGDGCINEVGGTFSPALADACSPGIALQGAVGVVPSADGSNVYVVSEESTALAAFGHPAAGAPAPAGAPPHDVTAPKVDGFSLSHRVFAVAAAGTPVSAVARGTAFRFHLSEPASVKISIARALPGRRVGKRCRKPAARLRHHRACTRSVRAGTLRRGEPAGAASVKFSGRIGRRAVKPGRYRATIRATDAAGNTSAGETLAFRVVAARR